MNEPLLAFSSPVGLLVGAAILVILFTVILATLRRVKVFPRSANVRLAICASLLAVIGIMRTFSSSGGPSGQQDSANWLDVILLPYTAMAIAMFLVLLLLLLGRLLPRSKEAPDRIKPRLPNESGECSRHDEDCEHPAVISEREDARPTAQESHSLAFSAMIVLSQSREVNTTQFRSKSYVSQC